MAELQFGTPPSRLRGDQHEGIGDEAATTVSMAKELKKTLPGMKGVIVDSILRGKHLAELADAGLITTNHPHARKNANRETGGRHAEGRIEKRQKLRTHTHRRPGGRSECSHDIIAFGAILYQPAYDDEGKEVLSECPVIGYDCRVNPGGGHRFYLRVRITCACGDQVVDVPLYHEDRSAGGVRAINRGEFLRFYPPNAPQFASLYGRRNDSESLHNQVKRRLRRMPAYRGLRQELFALAIGLANNALTRAFTRRRGTLPNALDGTE